MTVDMPVKATDALQDQLADYGLALRLEDMAPDDIHEAKVRIIDTLGALLGGFMGEPCRIARNLAATAPNEAGATVFGTRHRVSPEMAAFANGTMARYVEMNDVYHWPGSSGGHPSDVIMPAFAAAESVKASGSDFLVAVVLAYEVYLRLADAHKTPGFDYANFGTVAVAMAAARLYGLDRDQMRHAIAMAAIPNAILRQVRTGHLSMWKAVTAGHSGRAGIFAAEMARAGMDGPHLPFAGAAGWYANMSAKGAFTLAPLGGPGVPFKVRDTLIKQRASCATTISSILAAEVAAKSLPDTAAVESVVVETYERAKNGMGTGEHHWHPTNRETADHSIPYVVAAALTFGTVGPREFGDDCLWDPRLRDLLAKIEVVTRDDYTHDYEQHPVVHRTRVRVKTRDGREIVGESGAEKGDLSTPKSDREIDIKFRSMAEPYLGRKGAQHCLDQLWKIETLADVGTLPPAFVFA